VNAVKGSDPALGMMDMAMRTGVRLGVLCGLVALVTLAPAVRPAAVAAVAAGAAPAVTPAAGPAFADDAPDPDVLRVGGTYYAYTTGTTWGNHIGVLESTAPDSGFHTTTGTTYGSTALGPLPGWERNNTQTSPGVVYYAGHYVMFYDAVVAATGQYCISVATSAAPAGPFQDHSSNPVICQWQLGGSVDPSPFVDPSGAGWLLWKSNGGTSAQAAHLWATPLGGDGTSVGSSPADVMDQDTNAHPWETTIEDPAMVSVPGTGKDYLFFAGGDWQSAQYAEGYAVCDSPTGPCAQPQAGPILGSYGNVAGPAAGNVFYDASGRAWMSYAAWSSSCTSYSCGGKRWLYVAGVGFAGGGSAIPVVSMARPGTSSAGYWITDAAGTVTALGAAASYGDLSAKALAEPIEGMASAPDGKGYWLVASDGGIFTFGDAAFFGSTGAIHLNQPIVGMAPTPDGRGYWLVASDGGIFTYGDAAFFGSAGGGGSGAPVATMTATADGRGYWLLGRDGSVLSFGDATYYGRAS